MSLGGVIAEGLDALPGLRRRLRRRLKARAEGVHDLAQGQWRTFGRFWRGGWRSTASWVIVATLFVHGVWLPLAWPPGTSSAMDWPSLAALVAALLGLTHYRSNDLSYGMTT